MKVWVDADACPNMIKDVLSKAAISRKLMTYFVANRAVALPTSPFLRCVVVSAGFDVADNYVVEQVERGDIVVTADIPMADEVITKGAVVISPRGEKLTKENIKPRLNMRDFLEQMRSSGNHTGGQAPLNASDKQQFANQLDRAITSVLRKSTR